MAAAICGPLINWDLHSHLIFIYMFDLFDILIWKLHMISWHEYAFEKELSWVYNNTVQCSNKTYNAHKVDLLLSDMKYKYHVILATVDITVITVTGVVETNTLCSEKNTHSHFLSYLDEWCVDLNKNCTEYTWGMVDSNNVEIRYSLWPVT